jgi:hypothetical protein
MCLRYQFCISDILRDAKIGDMHSPAFVFIVTSRPSVMRRAAMLYPCGFVL